MYQSRIQSTDFDLCRAEIPYHAWTHKISTLGFIGGMPTHGPSAMRRHKHLHERCTHASVRVYLKEYEKSINACCSQHACARCACADACITCSTVPPVCVNCLLLRKCKRKELGIQMQLNTVPTYRNAKPSCTAGRTLDNSCLIRRLKACLLATLSSRTARRCKRIDSAIHSCTLWVCMRSFWFLMAG